MSGRSRLKEGVVVSAPGGKTVIVRVERRAMDPVYKKVVKKKTKFKAHDEKNRCRLGDRVQIVPSRPLSREKRWRIQKILVSGVAVESVADVPELAPGGTAP